MGMIKNIRLMITSFGAKQVKAAVVDLNQETEKLTKTQTRQANESAAAGKKFAAQSKGLGGLVAVYAGIAANVFAVQQAFSGLTKAAQSLQIIEGTRTLALNVSESGEAIQKAVNVITKGQLTIAEAALQINTGLSAGFSGEQLKGLSESALKASRALGRDLQDSMNRLVRGTAKLEPELLDELGIFIRLDKVTKDYAKANGLIASQLTEYERRQAAVNAVIDQANRKFGDINTRTETAAETLEKFRAEMIDLGTAVGSTVATFLQPFVSFLNGSIGTIITAGLTFATIALGVFRKQMLSFLNDLNDGIDTFANKITGNSKILGFNKEARERLSDLSNIDKKEIAAKTIGTFTGGKERKEAGASILSSITNANKLGRKDITIITAEIEKQLDIERKHLAIQKEKRAAGNLLQATLDKTQARINLLTKAQEQYNFALANGTVLGVAFTKTVNGISVALKALSFALNRLFSFLNIAMIVIGTIQTVGSFFGFDFVGSITEAVKSIGQRGREVAKTGQEISNLLFNTESLKNTAAKYGIVAAEEIKKVGELVEKNLIRADNDINADEIIRKSRNSLSSRRSTGRGTNALARTARQKAAAEETIKMLTSEQGAIFRLSGRITTLSEETGVARGDLSRFASEGLISAGNAAEQLSFKLDKSLQATTNLSDITDKKLGLSLISTVNSFQKIKTLLSSNNVTAEELSQTIGNLQKSYDSLIESSPGNELLIDAERLLEASKRVLAVAKLSESIVKGLNSQFSKEISLSNNLIEQGGLDLSGNIDLDSTITQARNLLETYIESENQVRKLTDANADFFSTLESGQQIQQYRNITDKVQEVLVGKAINSYRELTEEIKKLNFANAELANNNKILFGQNTLAEIERNIKAISDYYSITIASEERILSIREISDNKNIEIQKSMISQKEHIIEYLKIEQDITNSIISNNNAILDIELSRLQIAKERVRFLAEKKFAKEDFDKFRSPTEFEQLQRDTTLSGIDLQALIEIQQKEQQILRARIESDRIKLNQEQIILQKQEKLQLQKIANDAKSSTQEIRNLNAKQSIEKLRLEQSTADIQLQRDKIQSEKNIAQLVQINNKQSQQQEIRNLELRFKVIEAEAKLFETFLTEINKTFIDVINSIRASRGLKLLDENSPSSKITEDVLVMTENFKKVINDREVLIQKSDELIKKGIEEKANAELESLDKKSKAAEQELKQLNNKQQSEKELLNIQQSSAKQALENELALLKLRLQAKNQDITNFDKLAEQQRKELEERQKLERDRSETTDAATKRSAELFNFIRVQVKDILTPAFESFFNTIFTDVLQGTKTLGQAFRDMFSDILRAMIEKITKELIMNNVTDLATSAGKGIFDIILSNFASGGPVKHYSSGGHVQKLASGGSSMANFGLRDSVPARLEPGEFVVKKQAVSNIGVNNLRAINRSNGMGMGSQQPPIIQIINQGTPQETKESDTKFDGKQFVTQIVVDDIRNNGPIKKSIKGLR